MSHREHCPPRARPRAPPRPLAGRPAARARIGWAGRVGARGGGGEACEQSVISECSGRRRKRELGIAAPSPFPYFLSTGPRPRPAGEGPRAPPPTARQCAPGGARAGRCRLRSRPPLPPPPSRGSLRNREQGRASFPPPAEARTGSLGDEELPGCTRSPPIPGLRLGCGRWSRVPAEARPPPSSCSPPPGSGRSLGALRPLGARDLSPPASAAGASSPTAASGSLSPRKPSLQAPRRAAPTTQAPGARPHGSRLDTRPPRLAVPTPPPSCRAPRQDPAPCQE